MKSLRIAALILFSMNSQETFAQTKTQEQINQITQAGQKIKDLFGKKKKEVAESRPPDANTGDQPQSSILNRNSAGTIIQNVKYIDVDEMSYFSLGAAWVRKGLSYSLIDSAGNFLVPFGKYNIFKDGLALPGRAADGYAHGIFTAWEVSTNRKGYLNNHGDFLPLPSTNSYYGEMCGEYIATKNSNGTYTYTDRNWHSSTMSKPMGDFAFGNYREGVAVGYTAAQRNGAKLGYKDIQNHFIIAPQFDFADAFWEGRAVVGKIDQFGEMKYGFINRQGVQIFPCVLSAMPSRFSSGRAKIEAKNNPDFDYAYIDTAGAVVIKCKFMNGLYGLFYKGYTISGNGTPTSVVMDTTGKIITLVHFQKRYGIESALYFDFPVYSLEAWDDLLNDKVPFRVQPAKINHICQGFFDIKTKQVVNGVFETEKEIRFDKTSKLSYAKMQTGNDRNGNPVFLEGYINTDGKFVILKKSNSQW